MKNKILIGIFLLLTLTIAACSTTGNATATTSTSDVFEIDATQITATAKFFEYEHQGTTVKFFAVRGSDGVVRTAFDACDVCGGDQGYTQQGSDIVCNSCGKVFKIDGLGSENKGYGCWPSYLPHTINGNKVVINTNDLIEQKYKFQ